MHGRNTGKIYRNDFEKKARREPKIHVGNEVYMDCSQHAAIASNSPEEIR